MVPEFEESEKLGNDHEEDKDFTNVSNLDEYYNVLEEDIKHK